MAGNKKKTTNVVRDMRILYHKIRFFSIKNAPDGTFCNGADDRTVYSHLWRVATMGPFHYADASSRTCGSRPNRPKLKTPLMGRFIMGRMTGLEPATFGTTNQRSNQLSYIRHTEFVWWS